MREVALIFDKMGKPIYWSTGDGSYIHDSRTFWDIIWENRERICGIAHTHPWDGPTTPSHTDITTWIAIEKGLGKKLLWPIVTMTREHYYSLPRNGELFLELSPENPWCWPFNSDHWKHNVAELRRLSRGEEHG